MKKCIWTLSICVDFFMFYLQEKEKFYKDEIAKLESLKREQEETCEVLSELEKKTEREIMVDFC